MARVVLSMLLMRDTEVLSIEQLAGVMGGRRRRCGGAMMGAQYAQMSQAAPPQPLPQAAEPADDDLVKVSVATGAKALDAINGEKQVTTA